MTDTPQSQARAHAALSRKEKALIAKAKIISVASREFAHNGFQDVQISTIAEKSGYAHSNIFHHFSSKRDLFSKAVLAMAEELFTVPGQNRNLAPQDQIRKLLDQTLSRLKAKKDLYLGYVRCSRELRADPQFRSLHKARERLLMTWLCEVCEVTLPLTAADFLIVFVDFDNMVENWLTSDPARPQAAVINAILQMVVGGLKAAQCYEPGIDVSRALDLLSDTKQA